MAKLGKYTQESFVEADDQNDGINAEVIEAAAKAEVEGTEIQGEIEALGDTPEAMNELATIHGELDDAEQEGGVDAGVAVATERYVNKVLKELGLRPTRFNNRGAFESSSSRRSSTRLAKEGVWDKIKEAFRALKNFIIGLYKKAVAFIRSLFLGAEKMKKSASDMASKVKALKSDKPETTGFEDDDLRQAFFFQKTMPLAVEDVLKTTTSAAGLGTDRHAAFKDLAAKVETIIKDIKTAKSNKSKDDKREDDDKNKEVIALVDAFAKNFTAFKFNGVGVPSADIMAQMDLASGAVKVEGKTVTGLLGNKTLYLGVIQASADQVPAIVVKLKELPVKSQNNGLVTAGSKAELEKICSATEDLAKAAEDADKNAKELEAYGSDLNSVIEKGISAADALGGDAAKEDSARLTRVKGVIAGAASAYSQLMVISSQLAVPTGNKALKYVQKSIACYKKAD